MKPASKKKVKPGLIKDAIAESIAKNNPAEESFVFIRVERTFQKVYTRDIYYIQALSDYIRVHTTDKTYITHSTMQQILDKLPVLQFIRVHRSYIIRIECIVALQEGFVMVNKKLIPIGRSYKKRLEERLTIV